MGTTFERALLRSADELHASRFISRSTWNPLAERHTDEEEVVEAVLMIGGYMQLAIFQNTLGAQRPPGFEGLPAAGGR